MVVYICKYFSTKKRNIMKFCYWFSNSAFACKFKFSRHLMWNYNFWKFSIHWRWFFHLPCTFSRTLTVVFAFCKSITLNRNISIISSYYLAICESKKSVNKIQRWNDYLNMLTSCSSYSKLSWNIAGNVIYCLMNNDTQYFSKLKLYLKIRIAKEFF